MQRRKLGSGGRWGRRGASTDGGRAAVSAPPSGRLAPWQPSKPATPPYTLHRAPQALQSPTRHACSFLRRRPAAGSRPGGAAPGNTGNRPHPAGASALVCGMLGRREGVCAQWWALLSSRPLRWGMFNTQAPATLRSPTSIPTTERPQENTSANPAPAPEENPGPGLAPAPAPGPAPDLTAVTVDRAAALKVLPECEPAWAQCDGICQSTYTGDDLQACGEKCESHGVCLFVSSFGTLRWPARSGSHGSPPRPCMACSQRALLPPCPPAGNLDLDACLDS